MKIFDPVHRFIRFNSCEEELIDSLPFQRLRYIHQVGVTFLVYPGARHTRFEHSMGTMKVATKIFDTLLARECLTEDILKKVSLLKDIVWVQYWRQVLRCAALCHDIGHTPFSHTLEEYLGKEGHEGITLKFIFSEELSSIWNTMPVYPGRSIAKDIAKLAIGAKKWSQMHPGESLTPWEKVVSDIITSDDFGADRIDYLLRDAFFTGVAYGVIDYEQLMESLTLVLGFTGEIEIAVKHNGIEAIESLLIARYFMHSRVYQHPSSKIYSFHLKNFVKLRGGYLEKYSDLNKYLTWTDQVIFVEMDKFYNMLDVRALKQRKERFNLLEIEVESESHIEEMKEKEKEYIRDYPEKIYFDFSRPGKGCGLGQEGVLLCLLEQGKLVPLKECLHLAKKMPPSKELINVYYDKSIKHKILDLKKR